MLKQLLSGLLTARKLAHARRWQQLGNASRAEAAYRRILLRHPGNGEAHRGMAELLHDRGDLDGALTHARQAVASLPGSPDAHNTLGVALMALSRLDEATAQFRSALRANADYAAAHANLGNALHEAGDLGSAIEHYTHATRLAPADGAAQLNLAMALEDEGRYADALAAYQRAYAVTRSDGIKIKMATMLPLFPDSAGHIEQIRRQLSANLHALLAGPLSLNDPAREVGQTNFLLPYQGRNDRDLQRRMAELYEKACPSLLQTASHCSEPRPRPGRLRVGFASKFFTGHSVGIWFNRVITLLAQTDEFEVVLINLGRFVDPELRRACRRYVAVPAALAPARETIANERLDVLVYADIGMDPLSYFLAFSRLAPVQCAMLGHPVTTGVRNVDYFISSALFEPPQADEHYTERLVRLNSLPVYIAPPELPDPPKPRSALGLPEDRTLYVCPMMLHKFHPDFDAAMAAILRRDPKGEVILFADARFRRRHERLVARIAVSHGDVVGRIRFRPWASREDLMSVLMQADVCLDSFHFSAGTTAFWVLAAGTPIVTLPGDFVRGRPTYGCYLKMGMMDCVARDPEDYVDLAVRLGTDRMLRESIRRRILESCGKLFADSAVVEELSAFLRRAA